MRSILSVTSELDLHSKPEKQHWWMTNAMNACRRQAGQCQGSQTSSWPSSSLAASRHGAMLLMAAAQHWQHGRRERWRVPAVCRLYMYNCLFDVQLTVGCTAGHAQFDVEPDRYASSANCGSHMLCWMVNPVELQLHSWFTSGTAAVRYAPSSSARNSKATQALGLMAGFRRESLERPASHRKTSTQRLGLTSVAVRVFVALHAWDAAWCVTC
jgi:hypothetical protein